MAHLSIVDAQAFPSLPPILGRPREAEPLDGLAEQLTELGKDASVEQAVEIGRLVVEQLYAGDLAAWRGRGPKAHSLRALARRSDLPVSSSALYRAIALYELSTRLGGVSRWSGAGLGISHLRLVLGLPDTEQRRLLDEAVSQAWTVAELEREAVLARKRTPGRSSRGGRPRLPRFVKSVNRLRKAAEAPDELFGDIEAASSMSPEHLAEIRDALATIRVRCAELDRALERASRGDQPAVAEADRACVSDGT